MKEKGEGFGVGASVVGFEKENGFAAAATGGVTTGVDTPNVNGLACPVDFESCE